LVSKPVGKRPLGRPRHGWDIKVYIWKMDGTAWTGLIWPMTETGEGLLWTW
jgi:hypothetical protein